MTRWIIRQPNPWVRCSLLLIAFPVDWFTQLCRMVLEGYGARILMFDYWDNTWSVFWACWDGAFVNEPK